MRPIPFMSSSRARKKNIYNFFDENYEKISIIHLVTSGGVRFTIFNKRKKSTEVSFSTSGLKRWSDKLVKKALNTGKFVQFGFMLVNKDYIINFQEYFYWDFDSDTDSLHPFRIYLVFKKDYSERETVNIDQIDEFESFLQLKNKKNIEGFMAVLRNLKNTLTSEKIRKVKERLYEYIETLNDEEKLYLEVA